jgi:polyhydroxyalkanoate synthesis regulator phasin
MGFEDGSKFRRSRKEKLDEHGLDRQPGAPHVEAIEDIEWFLRSHERYIPIDGLIELRDKWVTRGAVTAAEVNALPAVRKAAERTLAKLLAQDAVHHAGFNTDDYAEIRDKWVTSGVVTVEDANHFPRIRDIAENDLFDAASAINSPTETVQSLKERWVAVGVLTEEEADRLIKEGRAERERYLHSPGGA